MSADEDADHMNAAQNIIGMAIREEKDDQQGGKNGRLFRDM